jgi:hypothetical protein
MPPDLGILTDTSCGTMPACEPFLEEPQQPHCYAAFALLCSLCIVMQPLHSYAAFALLCSLLHCYATFALLCSLCIVMQSIALLCSHYELWWHDWLVKTIQLP